MTLLPRHLPGQVVNLLLVSAFTTLAVTSFICAAQGLGAGVSPARADAAYGNLPLSFEANRGQADPSVLFVSHSGQSSLLLTANSAVLLLQHRSNCPAEAAHSKSCPQPPPDTLDSDPGAAAVRENPARQA